MQILDKTNPVTGTSNPCNFLDEIKGYQHSVVFITVALILLFSLEPYAQNVPTSTKIDPLYRQLISESKNDKVLLNGAPFSSRVEATEGYAIKNGPMEKRYECIVYTNNAPALRGKGITINSTLPSFVTAWITLEQISEMAAMDFIKYIEAPRTDYLHNDVSVGNTGASLLHQGNLNNTAYKGKNVLVAIYDSGIDWDHFDFRDPNDTSKSRIIRIWDQTLTAVTGEAPPSGFSYGVEYTQTQINDELDGTPANIVRERDFNGHGTHVAGTAAGNGSAKTTRKYMGLAPEADLIIIKGGESSFSTNRIIDGITYLQNLATSLGKPLVMNMSLGGQFGPHDGTRSYEIAVDNFTASAPGRAVVISAGNDNGTNLHNRITLAGNATTAIVFNVPASSLGTDVFEYRLYSKDSSAVSATVIPPDSVVNVTANAGEIAEGLVLTDSFSVQLSNFVDISNNSRFVDVYVDRVGSNTKSPAGTWTLSITNNTANTLAIDGWLYYRNASFGPTSLVGGNSDYLVGSPGNANSAITVASFAGRNGWYSNAAVGAFTFPNTRVDSISSFSSRGPRRDEVLKPEIAANGELVVSSLSSNNTSYTSSSITDVGLYVKNQGTSMSAPVTTGAVALLMQANPAVTSAQIKGYITATANKDVMTELTATTPNPSWGYGRLDVFKAASAMFNCTPAERRTYQYDSSTRNAQEMGTTLSTQRAGVRFTPDINGKLGGVFFNTSTAATGLNLQVRANNAGNPGDLLGSVNIDSAQVARYSWNYVDLSNLNITTANGV
ncbi:MAG: S8 family serine peptidase, partial [Chitinophagaceae bacterium]